MERADKGLAFMMQYENVAWYDGGEVRILDRRVYPRRVEFVTCRTHREVKAVFTWHIFGIDQNKTSCEVRGIFRCRTFHDHHVVKL